MNEQPLGRADCPDRPNCQFSGFCEEELVNAADAMAAAAAAFSAHGYDQFIQARCKYIMMIHAVFEARDTKPTDA
jgi:hypothetical protein